MNKIGIDETMEVMELVELLVVTLDEVLEDGSINYKDTPAIINFFKKWRVILNAIKNSGKIPSEIADIDKKELAEIGLRFLEIVARIKEGN